MTDKEFYELLDKWEETPECQEYYKYCEEHENYISDEETMECAKLMLRAFNNELGKQLIVDERFQRILTGDITLGMDFEKLWN